SSSISQTATTTTTSTRNACDLMRHVSESHIILKWLSEIGLENYYDLFVKAGYLDLLTISKATPADLSAIGVLDPSHRCMLKQHMSKLDVGEMEEKLDMCLMHVDSVSNLLNLI